MTENTTSKSTDDTSLPPIKKGTRRQTILIVVLLLLGGGLIYDRQVARPRSQQAYDKALELVDKNMAAAEGKPVTNQMVQAAFGKKPSKLVETEDYTIETFRWRRGLLVLNYDVNVVYAHDDGELVLNNAFLNKLPEESQLPGYEHPPVLPPPGEG